MRRILGFIREMGLDPKRFFKFLLGLPRYLALIGQFFLKRGSLGNLKLAPIFSDFGDSAGSADGHYFWQDLICANWIYDESPKNHLDVGSRIDGFIAHLLSFREVTMLDIRPMDKAIPNLNIAVGNAQEDLGPLKHSFESVSSLHSIEHFGLGRYGDPIDPLGHEKGLKNISDCVASGGKLYVSFPIGEAVVEFNAQRIIDPLWPVNQLPNFVLEEFVLIPWKGQPVHGAKPAKVNKSINGQCGLYIFRRVN